MAAPRKFDHNAARERYATGETMAAIARDVGVSEPSVARVVKPGRAAAIQKRFAAVCEHCEGPCVHNKYNKKPRRDNLILCQRCRAAYRRRKAEARG